MQENEADYFWPYHYVREPEAWRAREIDALVPILLL
jgi:hypothetical protein